MTKRICLIGMSNIGKSSWARRIAARTGYEKISCDALIEKKMKSHLADKGFKGLRGMASWMGFPGDERYKENAALYMACEKKVMCDILERLQQDKEKSFIIDTSGSVIYSGDEILKRVRKLTRVVYLEASDEHREALFKRFFESPKPLVWADAYTPHKNENPQEAMKRCYPALLRDRARRYGKLAHDTIPFDIHRNRKADIDALLRAGEA
jgi:shikimate kinase